MARVLDILKQKIIEANTILKNNVAAGIMMMRYTNALMGPDLTKNTVFWWQNSVEDFD